MKMRKMHVRWEKIVEAVVYVPDDMTDDTLQMVALHTAQAYDFDSNWQAEWDAFVTSAEDVDLPDAERRIEMRPSPYTGRPYPEVPKDGVFDRDGAMVVSDDRGLIVTPTDATWWLADGGEA